MKINGETHYLWQAVDYEGEVLETYVTKRRDRKAALKFLRKLMKRYGPPKVIVTDRLRSYGATMLIDKRWVVGRITGQRIRTSRFDDGNERCSVSDECEVCKYLPQFTLLSTTISTKNDTFIHEIISSLIATLLSPSGDCFVPPKFRRILAN